MIRLFNVMQFFWTFRSLPELNHLTDDQKSWVIRLAITWEIRRRMAVRIFLAGGVAGMFASFMSQRHTPLADMFGAITALAVGVWIFQVDMKRIRGELRRFLVDYFRGRKLPVCLRCGYDQTGNETDRCPECGANIRMPEK